MILIHGEHTALSRKKLIELITAAKQNGSTVHRLEAKQLDRGQLESALTAQDLFGGERVIVIENLHSLPKSTKKNELIALVSASSTPVILWESRELTKTMIKQFSQAEVHHFPISKKTFAWLDSLHGTSENREKTIKLFHESLAQEEEYFLFLMFIRQIRLLIQSKDGGTIKAAPFVVSKLKKQADTFTLPQLVEIYQKLLEIDTKQKTSSNVLTLVQELDLLQLTM